MTKITDDISDISDLTIAPSIIHEIQHPKLGGNLGVRVTLLSMTDPEIKKIGRRYQDHQTRLATRGKIISAEEKEEFQLEVICAATIGWDWYDKKYEGVSNPPFSKKTLRECCVKYPWFLADIDDKLGDTKAFFA